MIRNSVAMVHHRGHAGEAELHPVPGGGRDRVRADARDHGAEAGRGRAVEDKV